MWERILRISQLHAKLDEKQCEINLLIDRNRELTNIMEAKKIQIKSLEESKKQLEKDYLYYYNLHYSELREQSELFDTIRELKSKIKFHHRQKIITFLLTLILLLYIVLL